MKRLFLLFAIAATIMACKTQQLQTVPQTHDIVRVQTEVRVDSIWRDRWHTEYVKGDTVHIFDSVYVDRFRWRDRVDSIAVHDTIPYEVQVPTRMRNGYDRFTSWGFWIMILLLAIRIAFWLLKKYYLHK